MIRPVRIGRPIDIGRTIMMLSAEDQEGALSVRIGLVDWEELRMAPPYLDDEDRRDAALSELEQLCEPGRIRLIDKQRIIDILAEEVRAIIARYEADVRR